MSDYYVIRNHPTGGFTYCVGNRDRDLDAYGGLEENLPVNSYSLKFSNLEEIYDMLPDRAVVIEHGEL